MVAQPLLGLSTLADARCGPRPPHGDGQHHRDQSKDEPGWPGAPRVGWSGRTALWLLGSAPDHSVELVG